MDGNYSLHKKTKRDDKDDTALSEGQGFFVPHHDIKPYLDRQYAQNAQKSDPKGGKRKRKGQHGSQVHDAPEDDPVGDAVPLRIESCLIVC